MKKIVFFLFAIHSLFIADSFAQKNIELLSPDRNIKLSVTLGDKIYYTVTGNNQILLEDCFLQMHLRDNVLGENPKLASQKRATVDEILEPVVPLKFSKVRNNYNSLLLKFQGDYSVEFRAFDNGVAYRFITDKKGDIEVMKEDFQIGFPQEYELHLQQVGGFKTGYEEYYNHKPSTDWKFGDKMSVLPVLIETKKGYNILISESDLYDYPCMFLNGWGKNGMKSAFPKVPLEFEPEWDRSMKILREADYIALTSGKRTFPWRYFVIADEKGIVENTMTYQLASKNKLQDVSWIKPGQTAWDWWNYAIVPGVDFKSGRNFETFKYFVDFASRNNIPYSILDEGWSKSTSEPFTPSEQSRLFDLIEYANQKNVGIFVWLTWVAVDNNLETLFKTYKEWGIKGVKIDFMDRSDQWMVKYYERVIKEAAKYQIYVLFHGSFKPAGLEVAYPNLLSYEGVRGLEQMGNCDPDNSIYLPFMRNAVGPMDFTPGAMINLQSDSYIERKPNPAAKGTRAYQMALFVVFESGIQMLADSPHRYDREPECRDFITSVPVTWDETKVLEAKIGEYIIVAKRKGNKWFLGGITNSKEERNFTVNMDFLDSSRSYKMTSFEDGMNADIQAMDYRKKEILVKANDNINIKMVRNGGFAAVIE